MHNSQKMSSLEKRWAYILWWTRGFRPLSLRLDMALSGLHQPHFFLYIVYRDVENGRGEELQALEGVPQL